MTENSMSSVSQQELVATTCALCQRGIIQKGKKLFHITNDFLVCPQCSVEFHRVDGKYTLRKIPPSFERWIRYDGRVLSGEEIQRIAGGGQSDAEIANEKIKRDEEGRQKAAAIAFEKSKREEAARQKAAEREEFLRKAQSIGTPEYFYARFTEF